MRKISISGLEIDIEEKPHRLTRLFLSTKDWMLFNYKTLAPAWRIALLISILLTILSFIFRRDFSYAGWAAPVAAALIFSLPFLKTIVVGLYAGKIRIVQDPAALLKIKNLQLSAEDQAAGFTYIPDAGGGVGVVMSAEVNRRIFLDPQFDIEIQDTGPLRSANLVESLASRGDVFSAYMTQKFLAALLSSNPLINEEKIGFCNSFWLGRGVCEVYKTTYFYSLCSGDLAMSMVCRDQGGVRRKLVDNGSLTSLLSRENSYEMRSLEDSRKPISLHGGVELMGVSKDYFLRVAVQGDHTQFSQGKKAPLGSGSMDWGDFEKSKTLKNLIKVAAVREFLEEWGKKHKIKEDIVIDDIVCLGFFRMPHRGGKPQFVVLCKFGNHNEQLRADESEVYVDEPEDNDCLFRVRDMTELGQAVGKILENADGRNSIPLLGAMSCLKEAMASNPALIAKTLGYP